MKDRYAYRTVQVGRAAWPRVAKAVHGSDATVFGLWRGEIGWYSDEGALMTVGPSRDPEIGGVSTTKVHRLEATARPVEPDAPSLDGIYAHRWFDVAPSDHDEFLELSVAAWPDFESAHDGTKVIGLWRDLDDPSQLLLVTRYASLAMWETSRPYNPNPVEGTDAARARFMRRANLTRRTIVRVGRLIAPHPRS